MIRRFDQPVQHGVGGDCEHPRGGANAEALCQAGQHVDEQLPGDLLAMKERAVVLREIPLARGALELAPGAATGMAIGPQVVQSQPTPVVTIGVRTKVPRGVHGPGATVRWGHGIGPYREQRSGLPGRLLTSGTRRLLGEARKRSGLGGALAAWHDAFGWLRLGWHVSAGPDQMEHDEQP
jgi:hypothetical protein